MRIRDDVLRVQDDMGTSGTLIYSLDYADPITELDLLVEGTNGATSNLASPLERSISKIELIDGGDVIWTMPGDLALAVFAHQANQMPRCDRTEGANGTPKQSIPLRFGRMLYDPIYAFNPLAFNNPQLRVTFDEATVRAAGATGYVSDSLTLTITAKLMEEADTPQGMLCWRDVYDFTTVASGDERVDLPVDRPIRAMAVRIYESGVAYDTNVTAFRLAANGGQYTPLNSNIRNFIDKMCETHSPLTIGQTIYAVTTVANEAWLFKLMSASIAAATQGYIAGISAKTASQVTPVVIDHDGAGAASGPCEVVTAGWMVHNTLLIPFGLSDVPETWLMANGFNKLELAITQGNAGAEANIAVQQLRRY